jgi:hypothetical protein
MSIRLMSLVFESNIEPNDKLVLLAMADYAADNGTQIFPSIETLVHKTSLSERTVQRSLRDLEAQELIVVVANAGGGRGKATNYMINVDKLKGVSRAPFEIKGVNIAEKGVTQTLKGVTQTPEPSLSIKNHHLPENSFSNSITESDIPTQDLVYVDAEEEVKPKIKPNVFLLAKAIGEVCQMDFELNKGRLFKEAKHLNSDLRMSPELIQSLYGLRGKWYTDDWRGRKGQPPRPEQISETYHMLLDKPLEKLTPYSIPIPDNVGWKEPGWFKNEVSKPLDTEEQ